mmetsp:Transcript_14470/g.14086  ORF Transcript_14470/g.14086 Transcript_14470/m.14086 type:complete len:121 (-) Transcript_14470:209-571(-)
MFGVVNTFFIFYAWFGHSLLNLLAKALLMKMIGKVVSQKMEKKGEEKSDEQKEEEWDKKLKEFYILTYILLNNSVQYLRNIIQIKSSKQSLVKTIVFMECFFTFNMLGDKYSLWLSTSYS